MLPPIGISTPHSSASGTPRRPEVATELPSADRTEAPRNAPKGTARTPPLVGPPPTFEMTMLEHLRATAQHPEGPGQPTKPSGGDRAPERNAER